MPRSLRPHRVPRVLDVVIQDVDDFPKLVRLSKTVNLSATGMLLHVPLRLDAAVGEEIVVKLRWSGGAFESAGRIVRFESPWQGDPTLSVMGVSLYRRIPDVLLEEPAKDADAA